MTTSSGLRQALPAPVSPNEQRVPGSRDNIRTGSTLRTHKLGHWALETAGI